MLTDDPSAPSKRKQCAKCPWLKRTNPRDIPGGYSVKKHRNLRCTIARGDMSEAFGRSLRMMACHETTGGNEQACVGWLAHQLGPGNNIGLRLQALRDKTLYAFELIGEQHESFEDTLPKDET